MVDFFMIAASSSRKGVIEIYPKFLIKKSKDLMIRGGDFYAVWLEEENRWSTDEFDVIRIVDSSLKKYAEDYKNISGDQIRVLYMWDAGSGIIDRWHKYVQKQMRDSYTVLDETILFANDILTKESYATHTLPYNLESGSIEAWDKLMSTLYDPSERAKLEWAIGAVVNGDSKKIQKFLVLYGDPGSGKSTVLNVIQKLFEGYYAMVDAKAVGSNNSFALETFRSNPLVAIQHEGDLSRIEDNTRLNSLVSHEEMTVNEKYKSSYSMTFNAFLFIGTNKPVKITDSKSGIIRRLLDVSPSGRKLGIQDYRTTVRQVNFELGAIAYHCKEFYEANKGMFDDYVPVNMLGATNDLYNFVQEMYLEFSKEDGTTLQVSWEAYKNYCEEANVPFPLSQRAFKEDLKSYFRDFEERTYLEDGTRVRNWYGRFIPEKFETSVTKISSGNETIDIWIDLKEQDSIFDRMAANRPAQYATKNETPRKKWVNVHTTLSDVDTSQLHYVQPTDNHIVIDFDIVNEQGVKDFELNLKEASKWPKTYAELSKGGNGIHLHYMYTGDVSELSNIYETSIEIKVFTGNSSLRRKLTKCNDIPVSTIGSGLPLKEEKKEVVPVMKEQSVKSEEALRELIVRNLKKEIHNNTTQSVSFIKKILDDAYESGLEYDLTDMKSVIIDFAASSTNQADANLQVVQEMQFASGDELEWVEDSNASLVFYDVEVYPNLFVLVWKYKDSDTLIKRYNPQPDEVRELFQYNLIGYNNRGYDNHILYARSIGYSLQQLYQLSQSIIQNTKGATFGQAYNLSYTDVYDFAAKKQSLKKWQIELGLHHQEMGIPWDQDVPEELWDVVGDYCANDVLTTEAVFNHLQDDWKARQIIADLAKGSVNDTTNRLAQKIIFGKDYTSNQKDFHKIHSKFNYRFLGDTNDISDTVMTKDTTLYTSINKTFQDEYVKFNSKGQPVFPGYKYEYGKSIYRGESVGEGGYVYAEPGMYRNVKVLDILSMHPYSIIAENLFGPYTKNFEELVNARIDVKHKDLGSAVKRFDGAIAKWLDGDEDTDSLSTALKIVINSVYGQTFATYENIFRTHSNVDNIVAKRGALFMVNLKHEVQKRGYNVIHIKTDSIKIQDASDDIIDFIVDFGKLYGYVFEVEDTYDRIALVNNAVYIAYDKTKDKWDAVGAQFQQPYVYKTLLSHEPIEFWDMSETKSVQSAIYLDYNEHLPDVTLLEKEKKNRQYNEAAIEHNKLNMSNPRKPKKLNPDFSSLSDEELDAEIAKGHDYKFVGRVGQFTPIKPGKGGAELMRDQVSRQTKEVTGKAYVSGTKGFRWLESVQVAELDKSDDIDTSYYELMVNDAIDTLGEFGDVTSFLEVQNG